MPREQELRQEIAALREQLHVLGAELNAARQEAGQVGTGERVLLCRAADALFALPLTILQEVVPVAAMKALPQTPSWIAGVLNLRQALIPVADLSARVTGQPHEIALTDLVVICLDGPWRVGLVVQEVSSVTELSLDALQTPAPDLPSAPYVSGTLRHEDALVLVLSLDRLMAQSALPEDLGG